MQCIFERSGACVSRIKKSLMAIKCRVNVYEFSHVRRRGFKNSLIHTLATIIQGQKAKTDNALNFFMYITK